MKNENILVIQTAFLGDAILTLPMIQKIKSIFPDSNVDVLCIPGTKEIFANSKSVADVIVYDKRGSHKSIGSLFKLAKKLRMNRYSRIYSPHRSLRTSLLILLTGVKETYGFDKSAFSFIYKNRIKYISTVHEVDRNAALIGSTDNRIEERLLPEISITEKTKRKIEEIITALNRKEVIAVAPGSVWPTKVYPKEYFIEIIKEIINRSYSIILIGGPSDKELCKEIESNFDNSVYSFAGELSIIESIQLIKQCKLLISNDSAPTHMGMCADIPTLTIYTSTIPGFGFYPYQKESLFISYDELSCKPCGIHGHAKCPEGTFACAWKLTPETIIKNIEKMLNI